MCSTNTPALAGSNALSNNLHNNPFLPGFSSSPGWLLVTRTPGAWCRFRGYWRSRPRHLSSRSWICAQKWHRKDKHSLTIHSHPPMHTPKKQTKTKILNSRNMTPSFTCPLPVQCGGGRRPGSLADAPQGWSMSEAFLPRTVLTENISRCVQHILPTFPDNIGLSNNLHNNPFLPGFSSTAGWLLVTRTPGAWCRFRGKWHPKDIRKNGILKTFTHTSFPIHPCTLITQTKSKILNSLNMWRSFRSTLPVNVVVGGFQKFGRCSSGVLHFGGLLAYDSTDRKHL